MSQCLVLSFLFLTLVSLHMQKYNMKPSFNLCSSSHFKCLWKKHFIESSAVNTLHRNTSVHMLSHPRFGHHTARAASLTVGVPFLSATLYFMESYQRCERKAVIWNQKAV